MRRLQPRLRASGVAALILLAGALAGASAERPSAERPAIGTRAVGPIDLTVSDMERSVDFYTTVLTFEKVSDLEVVGPEYERLQGVFGVRMRVVGLRLGDEELRLTEYLAPRGRPAPPDARSNDRWFQHVAVIVSDMDSAYRRLRHFRVQHASTGPQLLPAWNTHAGGIRAFYFKDPDGHPLEILSFPPDKGAAKWHRPSDKLFLGIDHTAIVVGSTERSLRFYRDLLGMRVAGGSENYGTEQEHLNNVEGAHLRITALRADAGPGVEFLQYLTPRGGRPYPADERPNDLVHWQTTLVVPSVDAAARAARAAGYTLVSRDVTTLPDRSLGVRRAVLVRDPDGHVMEIAEP